LQGLHQPSLHFADPLLEEPEGSGLAAAEGLFGSAPELIAELCQLALDVVVAPVLLLAVARDDHLCRRQLPGVQYRNALDNPRLSQVTIPDPLWVLRAVVRHR
jgi:hypothetical protein